jgi:WD40 repeat protein
MSRHFLTLILPVVLTAFAPAAPEPKLPPDATKDRDGNPLPKGATARLGSRPFHGNGWHGISFSSDGKRLRAIPDVEQVRAWDADTGKTLPALPIQWGDTADGEHVVASTIAGNRAVWVTQPADRANAERVDPKAASTAYVFDLADGRGVANVRFTGTVRFELPHQRMGNAAVAPDGTHLAVAPENTKTVEVLDLATGKRLHTHALTGTHDAGIYISPDSKTLYVAERRKPLRRFELAGGKELPTAAESEGNIDLIAVSPDGKRLVVRECVGCNDDGGKKVGDPFLTVRDLATTKTLGKFELGAYPMDFEFAGSDAVIVLTGKFREGFPPVYALSRWNATTLKREWEVPGPELPFRFSLRVVVSPDGKRFAFTDRMNFVHVYDAGTGKRVGEQSGHNTWPAWVGFSADGEQITTIGRDGVFTWAPNGERKSFTSPPELTRGRIHPTLLNKHLVWVTLTEDEKSAQLVGWDPAKGKIGWRMPVEGDGPDRVLTSDGKRCVGVAWNKGKRLWDVTVYDGPAGRKVSAWTYDKVEKGGMHWWWPMALAADGETLFIAGDDGIVGFDVPTGKEKLRIGAGKFETDHGPAAFPMAVSNDGKRIAIVKGERKLGKVLRVLEIKTGQVLATHVLGEVYRPALRFSPGGNQIAVWNVWGSTVQVCDTESDKTPPRKLAGGNYRAWCAAFSPNGASLAVGYEDGTALVWDLTVK